MYFLNNGDLIHWIENIVLVISGNGMDLIVKFNKT